jgi:hypothetical protein
MSINTREDANKYYNLINELVDDYIDNWKIRPSNLKRYLKPGSERFNKFLLRNKLSEIKGASVILSDIIEDRSSMEKDGVLTFETFKYFESETFKIDSLKECLYKGIEKADIKMEKILADFFDTNLSSIDILDADKHIFKLEDWENDDWNVIIYSKEDLQIIQDNIIEHLYKEISEKEVELTSNIKIGLSKLINQDIFNDLMFDIFNEDKLVKTITDLLSNDYKFKSEESGYFIWIS